MLFIVWLTMRMPERVKSFPPIEENAAGRADNAEGFERDFEPPGAEEVEELMEPTLQDTIEAVTDAVSSVAGALDTMNTSATASTAGTERETAVHLVPRVKAKTSFHDLNVGN